jgi:hypothetical protein
VDFRHNRDVQEEIEVVRRGHGEDVMDLLRRFSTNARGLAALNAAWLLSVVWLVLAAAGLIYDFAWWLMNPNDSRRYETVISSGIVLLISVPALLIVMLVGLLPRTGISGYKRTSGIALALFCIGIFLLHSYLQGKPR